MRIDVVTLFPSFFASPLAVGLVGKSIAAGRAEVAFVDPREYTSDRHRSVDDTPYGGGAGMVMKPEPLLAAIAEAKARGGGPVVLLTPQGRPLRQSTLREWSALPHLIIVCGRYEGVDERVRARADREVSLGDFVLTGGEPAALALIDGLVRLLPGTVGDTASTEHDSFSDGLLEHPHYTRPEDLDGARVPEVLLGGDHAKVGAWRQRESLARTRARRPDLLTGRGFTRADRRTLFGTTSSLPPVEVILPAHGAEIGDLARIAAAFGIARLTIVPLPGPDAKDGALRETLESWRAAARAADPPPPRRRSKRAVRLSYQDAVARASASNRAIERVFVEPSLNAAIAAARARSPDVRAIGVADSIPEGARAISPEEARMAPGPIALVFGGPAEVWLPPIRTVSLLNDLPLAAAFAAVLERLLGEG